LSARKRNLLLFVGAGVSASLGIPTYDLLIDHLAEELGYEPKIFRTLGDYMTLAEYYLLEKKSLGPLRSWMDKEWHSSEIDVRTSEIHRLIVNLDSPLIYTTNYDSWLERAHDAFKKPFTKIANVGDIAKATADRTQIVKFHGDFEDDKSIVLSESSYLDRLSFESPLDVKLRSDVLGKAVLFIGYSLSDINLRYLLYRLQKQWAGTVYEDLRPESYIFLTRPNEILEKVLMSRGVTAVVSDDDDHAVGLEKFLAELNSAAFA
jgi:SIR2-like domain